MRDYAERLGGSMKVGKHKNKPARVRVLKRYLVRGIRKSWLGIRRPCAINAAGPYNQRHQLLFWGIVSLARSFANVI